MMDGFVDYVSINNKQARGTYLCIVGCTKFTFEAIDKCVCISYIHLWDSYVGHILLIPPVICSDTNQ